MFSVSSPAFFAIIRATTRRYRTCFLHVWTTLQGYIDPDWDDLHYQLCEEYMNPSIAGQFSGQKLVDFASKYARTRMCDESEAINSSHPQPLRIKLQPLRLSHRRRHGAHKYQHALQPSPRHLQAQITPSPTSSDHVPTTAPSAVPQVTASAHAPLQSSTSSSAAP